MAAYLVFSRIRTKDKAALERYFNSGDPNAKHPFKQLVGYGTQEVLEGEPHEGMVILEFPTYEEAKAWYHSPFYQSVSKHRIAGADYQVTLVQGK